MEITIRTLEDADLRAVAELCARRLGTGVFWLDRIGRYLRCEHSPQHALSARIAFVAVNESGVLGFVAGHRTRRFNCEGEVQWIDVAEMSQGQGIAYRLLTRIAGWFVEHNARRVCVNVDPKNTAACSLYMKSGAQPLNEHWMIWNDARAMAPEHGRRTKPAD